jgi:medium-chain acyl-[acyl-carrier-protein] hydrolase
MPLDEPLHSYRETLAVRANETDEQGRVTAPALCNYLQEMAATHAGRLGVGIQALRDTGRTWMLSRLYVRGLQWPVWRDTLTVETWPSGVRSRLVATRDFRVRNAAGAVVAEAISEWIYVDTTTLRIMRLPDDLLALAPAGTPRVDLPEAGRLPELTTVAWATRVTVRRSEIDYNHHVNNVHYADWLFEPLPPEETAGTLATLDISYRAAAQYGDTVLTEAARLDDHTLVHRIRRERDGVTLVQARTVWA